MSEALLVFIGHDPREHLAYEVCRYSLLRHAKRPIRVIPLHRGRLEHAGFFDRPYHLEGNQPIDDRDGRPFSTAFAFNRFLVPAMTAYSGMAVFCDCDFLFTADINSVLEEVDPSKAVSVVKHSYMPRETRKMDGMSQTAYSRKNWSSFVVWNCEHEANRAVTAEVVNHKSGKWLHSFSWLADHEIGSLLPTWNYLSGVNSVPESIPNAIHFTLGGPWFENHTHHPYSELWIEELLRMRHGDSSEQSMPERKKQ